MQEFIVQNPWVILLAAAWTLPWKGIALWKAANLKSKVWFIVLLLVNTVGILEILYILIFSKIGLKKSDNSVQGPKIIDSNKLNKMKMGL